MPNNKIIFRSNCNEKAIFLTRNFLKPKLPEINVLIKNTNAINTWHVTKRCNKKYVKSSSLLILYHFML